MGFEKADWQIGDLSNTGYILWIYPEMRNVGFVYLAISSLVIKYSKACLFKLRRIANRKDLLYQIGHATKIRNKF